ncbi:MAG: cation:proton antiporter [Bacteroidales bacterium]|jgi:monovalent cation:H+ antiporter-2, CPA2 family|nr:cation:proton antiporter [Bacteroidales bacterium]MCI1733479.1 cation:proton antiporter [Bacteroidales bacterium]
MTGGTINPMLADLALILIVAGVVTIIFKALKQPLVLGYIIAGIFTGPYISFIPTATQVSNVEFWGKIGMIFLLFGLGLEFSFKKLKKVGGPGFITVFSEAVMMFAMGFLVGRVLGWGWVTSLFLGAMLSISSTSIIIKAFGDLGLSGKKSSQLVFGTLICEDLIAILLLVMLPAIVVGKTFNGSELINKAFFIGLFLVLWFTFGIYFIPTVYRKLRKLLSDETLIVVSLGLCLLMVVITVNANISEALGAFVMGSILSGTMQRDKIIQLTKPIKDFFGAIFFVSVGMLVDPSVLLHYWPHILLITVTVITMKPLSATIGYLFSGQTFKIALTSGMCLCQIGEFSYIIATMGRSLDVTPPYLYPVIVTVSILTTFVTPYWIKLGEPAYNFIYAHAKPQWRTVIERLGTGKQTLNRETEWRKLIRSYSLRVILYSAWLFFVFVFFTRFANPFIASYIGVTRWTSLLMFAITVGAMTPFLWGLLRRKDNEGAFDKIWEDKKFARGPLLFMRVFKYIIAIIAVSVPASIYITRSTGAIIVICAIVIIYVEVSKKIKGYYSKIENRFLTNLQSEGGRSFAIPKDMAEEMHIDKCKVEPNSFAAGRSIGEIHREKDTGALVIQIIRGAVTIDLPAKEQVLYPEDSVILLGSDEQIKSFSTLSDNEPSIVQNEDNPDRIEMKLFQFTLGEKSQMVGQQANITSVREKFKVLIVGVEKKEGNDFLRPTSSIMLEEGDTVWVVGSKKNVEACFNLA